MPAACMVPQGGPTPAATPTANSSPAVTATPVASNSSQATRVASNGLGNGLAEALRAKKEEDTTLAGSLADALKKRGVTRDSDEEDDDDDW